MVVVVIGWDVHLMKSTKRPHRAAQPGGRRVQEDRWV